MATTVSSIFRRLDRDGDRAITQGELKTAARELGVDDRHMGRVAAVHDSFDVDGDGSISERELGEGTLQLFHSVGFNVEPWDLANLDYGLREWIIGTDRDDDYRLSLGELVEALERQFSAQGDADPVGSAITGAQLLQLADDDGDGALGFSELTELLYSTHRDFGPKD